ncbi:exodeoxyribonuclease VII small subunit [Candidatus Paracaedibacter symbiosus]|uniref:exodeoxyribonuclease VII small subunit n=1 Tax=Candidatus Paracaedibacter symbiosus TaxID=244582 RepID=UPI000509C5E7|nr:exodeoxyribonuclease VII small subunit [Candidatus Paracaedibacter symbiosus]
MTEKTTNGVDELSFEQAMQELEILVRRLEEGRLPLEEAIQAYERGTLLKNHCETKLQAAKLRVDQVVLTGPGGASLAPFDAE